MSSRRAAYLLLLVFELISGLVLAERSFGGNEPVAGSLEDYLKRVGYSAINFERGEAVQPFVEGEFNGGHKRRFWVDTGWGTTTLDESVARNLKHLGGEAPAFQDSVLGTIHDKNFVLIDKLRVAGVEFLRQPARVTKLRADYIQLPFDGVLGYDFLLRNFCLIDCWKRRLYVRATEPSKEEANVLSETLRLSGFTELSLRSEGMLSVAAQVNGRAVRLGVDTGAPYDELDDSQLSALGLTLVKQNQAPTGSLIPQDATGAVVGVGTIGKRPIHVSKLETLQIGTRTLKGLYVGIVDLRPWSLAKPGTGGAEIKGLLSMTSLSLSAALIDTSGGTLWLRPVKPK